MKKSLLALFATGIAAATISISSCTPDFCKDVSCGAYDQGQCVEGVCVCNAGYYGDSCTTEWRANFIGTAHMSGTTACTVSGNSDIGPPSLIMTKSSWGVTEFNIAFWGSSPVLVATCTSSSAFYIPTTGVGDATYSGSGQLSGTTLTVTLSIAYPDETCVVTGTGTIQ